MYSKIYWDAQYMLRDINSKIRFKVYNPSAAVVYKV